MKRVLIIGSSGSGKSTLAKELHEILALPLIHLDIYRHKPNWEQIKGKEWEEKVISFCEQPSWIMDGNYGGTMELRMKYADTIIFLHFSRIICLYRGLERTLLSNRVDLIKGCKERMTLAFIKWIWTYNDESAPKVRERLKQQKSKKIIILKSPREVKKWIRELSMSNDHED